MMRRWLTRAVRFLVVPMSLVLLVSTSAFAADDTRTTLSAEQQQQYVEQGMKAARFMTIEADGIHFDAQAALKAGMDKETVAGLTKTFDKVNATENAKHFDWQAFGDDQLRVGADATASRTFWTTKVVFTEPETDLIINTLQFGVGIGVGYIALAALLATPTFGLSLPGSAIAGIAAGLCTFAYTYIAWVNSLGGHRGVYLKTFNVAPLPPVLWHN